MSPLGRSTSTPSSPSMSDRMDALERLERQASLGRNMSPSDARTVCGWLRELLPPPDGPTPRQRMFAEAESKFGGGAR